LRAGELDASLKFELLFYRLDSLFAPKADRKYAASGSSPSRRVSGAPS
jgi:hypothetical protein